MLLDYIHLSHLKVQMVSITDQYNYMIYSVSHSVLQSCGTEVGEPLSGSHPRFNFHLTKTQTRTVPASLPCIWHSRLQICAQPAGLEESRR